LSRGGSRWPVSCSVPTREAFGEGCFVRLFFLGDFHQAQTRLAAAADLFQNTKGTKMELVYNSLPWKDVQGAPQQAG
jgi:hypothetical protein